MANVTNVKKPMSTNVVLIMVLMVITIICLGALSLDYRHKIKLLHEDVQRLESTQVLLMVPDEQAEAIATWLATHPDQTQAMLKLASPGEQKAVTVDLNAEPSSINLALPPKSTEPSTGKVNTDVVPAVVSENADGVKVISLPNGGIRVTTREGD